MVVMIGSAALAVDIGQMTNKNRTLQAVADVIALDAARALGGRGSLSGRRRGVHDRLAQSAARNNFSTWPSSRGRDWRHAQPSQRRCTETNSLPTTVPTAVRVTAQRDRELRLPAGDQDTNRSATAISEIMAGFSIGSFLASIPAGGDGILNAAVRRRLPPQRGQLQRAWSTPTSRSRQIGLNMPVTALSPTQLLSTVGRNPRTSCSPRSPPSTPRATRRRPTCSTP